MSGFGWSEKSEERSGYDCGSDQSAVRGPKKSCYYPRLDGLEIFAPALADEEWAEVARVYHVLEGSAGGGAGKWVEAGLIFRGLGGEEKTLRDELFERGADGGGFTAESDGGSVGLVGFRLF